MKKDYIDKIAFIFIKDKKILVTLSIGKDALYLPSRLPHLRRSKEENLID